MKIFKNWLMAHLLSILRSLIFTGIAAWTQDFDSWTIIFFSWIFFALVWSTTIITANIYWVLTGVLGTVVSALYTVIHLDLTTVLGGR